METSKGLDRAVILETERLILRRWRVSDAPAALDLWGDPRVMRFVGSKLLIDLADAQNAIERACEYEMKHGYCRWALKEKASSRVIGSCGFLYDEGHSAVDVGYYFVYEKWGKGLASEILPSVVAYGFDHYGFDEIIAAADVENFASHRVLEKAGFMFDRIAPDREGNLDRIYRLRGGGRSAAL